MLEAGNFASGCDATDGADEQPVRRQYTLKGVEAEAIDLMRTAAQREGMKISAWVSQRLREAAEKSLAKEGSVVGTLRSLQTSYSDADAAWLVARIHELEREVQELNKTQRLMMTKLLEHL